ncbi:carboxymuconolactone decarboxylase family protein [Lutimaribacter sp. EGI FJ00015]|uniref:Carboxymuconolactone decarboxylase family protein n=1 Tax=Lutimaribacter degradans TaxID=2945989 RepID=A0ACC5ZX86_9RHOB|nr:carboxymuconolactone decarboxylase family protein [Lutimaribacter sp. EGI FJ00013]MCM2562939.1 carboxymuconolactone decarboxylase family protein [Lutimaribacter sp. EGI FJ00013]MCO0614107.1 carboxymuconolactone decarboxylase family protein [Lutimaribacter sp. EGI FJ00015]MCO0636084.1 carboxymuconolactone decarboxylase family protein [Lutimaribacter sp. EGI FJ00014]
MAWTETLDNTRNRLRVLYKTIPDVTRGFGAMSKAVKEGGVLDFKTKEFVALGIAVGIRCESCIALHVEALVKAGATRDEIADVLGMSIQMGGGPATMYASKALECFDELTEQA